MKNRKPTSPSSALSCPHCGLDQNIRGQPFTQSTMVQHIRKMHPEIVDESDEPKPENALVCDVCGAWKSKRGMPFMSQADLVRHRTITHSEKRTDKGDIGMTTANEKSAAAPKRRSKQVLENVPVKFCPQCGCNVEVIAAALSFLR